jgi:hypothetical protein
VPDLYPAPTSILRSICALPTPHSPNLVEGALYELRLNGVLRSLPAGQAFAQEGGICVARLMDSSPSEARMMTECVP